MKVNIIDRVILDHNHNKCLKCLIDLIQDYQIKEDNNHLIDLYNNNLNYFNKIIIKMLNNFNNKDMNNLDKDNHLL